MKPQTATPSSIQPASLAAGMRLEAEIIPPYPLMTAEEALAVLHASLERWRHSGKEPAPRPTNKFLLYRTHVQSCREGANGTREKQTDASKAIRDLWGQASPQEKEHYGKLAEIVKSEHERLVPGYKYDPKRKRRQRANERVRSPGLEGGAEGSVVRVSKSRSQKRRSSSSDVPAPYPQTQRRATASSNSTGLLSTSGSIPYSTNAGSQTQHGATAAFATTPGLPCGAHLAAAYPGDIAQAGTIFRTSQFTCPTRNYHGGPIHEPAFFASVPVNSVPPTTYSAGLSTPTTDNLFNPPPMPPPGCTSYSEPVVFWGPGYLHPTFQETMEATYVPPLHGPAPTSIGVAQAIFPAEASPGITNTEHSYTSEPSEFPKPLSSETYSYQLGVAIPNPLPPASTQHGYLSGLTFS